MSIRKIRRTLERKQRKERDEKRLAEMQAKRKSLPVNQPPPSETPKRIPNSMRSVAMMAGLALALSPMPRSK